MINERQYYSIGMDDISDKLIYVPQSFDAAENGAIWHRVRLFAPCNEWKLWFYASDHKTVTVSGKEYDLDKYFKEHTVLKSNDSVVSAPFWGKMFENPEDALLYAYKGRFLWVRLERPSLDSRLEKIRLYYPASSFTRYLPSIYRQADFSAFLTRFTAIFQSIYLDLEEKIAEFPQLLEPDTADNKMLPVLAEWLGCEEFFLLPDDKKGAFLLDCVELYRRFGTRSCMEEVFGRLCGEKPIIIEYMEFEDLLPQKRIKEHFGDDILLFTLITREIGLLPLIKAMVEKLKPSHTQCNVVGLTEEIVLDRHTYLGINSRLAKRSDVR